MFRGCSGNVSICSTSGLEPTTFADVSTTIRPGRAGALCDKFPIFISINSQPPHTTRFSLITPGRGSALQPIPRRMQSDLHSLALLWPCYRSRDVNSLVPSEQGATQVISGHYGSTQDKREPHPAHTSRLTQKEQESEHPQPQELPPSTPSNFPMTTVIPPLRVWVQSYLYDFGGSRN